MQIHVECGGFTEAADACRTANQTAAVLTQSLGDRLGAYSGMAGNDATSLPFTQAYDTGAREALAALVDLTHAFIGTGRLLRETGTEHASAEALAAGRRVSGYSGGSLDDAFVRVRPAILPSSLGSQEPSLGHVDAWILDQVEGFAWPGADVDQLRAAGAAWRHASASTAVLADHLDAACALLGPQRSPEVPLALDALEDLGVLVGDTAWQLSTLATACEDYADAVEDTHARTRALLAEVAHMIVEGAALSVLISGLSGGLGGAAAAGAAAARVRAQAPRFYALLVALRAGITTATSRLERSVEELVSIRSKLAKFVRLPARGERGSIKHPASWGGRGRQRGWLRDHEIPPGHTIDRHVGKTPDELAARLAAHPKLSSASSFADQATAERLISKALDRRSADLDAWLAHPGQKRLTLVEQFAESTGTTVMAGGSVTSPTGIRIVLIADNHAPEGWRILTAFPD